MQSEMKIRELGTLLQNEFGKNVIVDSFTSEFLTAPGENYGSTMLKVDAVIRRDASSQPENLYAVAKMIPSNDLFKGIFQTAATFPKEIAMYEQIIPAYLQLQKENDVESKKLLDLVCKCYGSRLNLHSAETFDDDAVILLENLKVAGYACMNRMEGLDLVHSELVMKTLSKFHALGVAVKLKKPELFEKLKGVATFLPTPSEVISSACEDVKDTVMSKHQTLVKYWHRIEKAFESVIPKEASPPMEPFGTICHIDFWGNNIMFHHDSNGKPDGVKFVDFQNYTFSSPARDMMFFLVSSTKYEVLEDHLDDLLNLYYNNFIGTLIEMKCDVSGFDRATFDLECKEWGGVEFTHSILMLKVITMEADKAKRNDEIESVEYFAVQGNEIYHKRFERVVRIFTERNWI